MNYGDLAIFRKHSNGSGILVTLVREHDAGWTVRPVDDKDMEQSKLQFALHCELEETL